jgi:ABC-type glycerol-3-phosphate transport system permease component
MVVAVRRAVRFDTRRIMLPLGKAALLSVGILDALFRWHDVLIALLMMPSAEHRTLMVGVTSLRGQYSDDIPTFASGLLIAPLPVLAIYLIFQRQIADGVTAGSTKG